MKFPLPTGKRPSNPTEPTPGLHGYTKLHGSARAQIHLRVEPDGRGLLLVNASRVVHLNPTATLMAWYTLEGISESEALTQMQRRFHASRKTLSDDFAAIRQQIEQLIHPNGACPIHDLELDILPPFSETPSAPYRMDLALTYRCNANCAHCYNARPRSYPEMDTTRWLQAIDILWDMGIPHICFTGGEATLRSDLPALIAYVQAKGQISGLLTNGRLLSDPEYVKRLVDAGLDHVQITLESHRAEIHDEMVRASGAWKDTVQGIQNALQTGLFVMTNTTLLANNTPSILETVDFLADLGVPTIGCNALIYSGRGMTVDTAIPESALAPTLEAVHTRTSDHGQRLIWYTPTQYCHFDPVQMQLGVKGCTAAMYNMCIEPDGGVIPCQSYYEQLGNILQDSWDSIWNHEIACSLRERRYIPDECNSCPMLQECGGGCPLTLLNSPEQSPMSQVMFPTSLQSLET